MRRPPSFPAHLLLDFPNWLGDLAMSLPAADRLIEANHKGRTTLHTRPSTARLLQSLYPHATVVVSHPKESARISAARLRKTVGPVDIGLSFRNALRAKSILCLSCHWSGGTSSQGGWALLSYSHRHKVNRHQVHDADALLSHLGLPEADPNWKMSLPGSLLREGETRLREVGLQGSGPRIALAPGVALGGSAKQWAPEKFGQLAAGLRARSYQPFISIGPGERGLADAINSAASLELPILGEKLDAAGLASLLRASDVVLGNDSGPAHLGAVLGVPVISLFGPTDPARTAPLGRRTQILQLKLPCAPCHQRSCPEGHGRCLRDMESSEVLQALEAGLEQDEGPARRSKQTAFRPRRISSGRMLLR